jgi:dynein heavy chain
MTMMFEVEDLLEASPATVSRCGMVYMNPEKLGWQVQTETWLHKLPLTLSTAQHLTLLRRMIDYFVPKITDFLFGTGDSAEEERLISLSMVIPATKNWIYRSFLSLLESLLLKQDTRDSIAKRA